MDFTKQTQTNKEGQQLTKNKLKTSAISIEDVKAKEGQWCALPKNDSVRKRSMGKTFVHKTLKRCIVLVGQAVTCAPTIVGNQQLDHLCKDDASSSSSSSIVGLTRPGQLEKARSAACRLLELLKLLEQLFYASRCVLMMPLQAPMLGKEPHCPAL